MFSVASLRDRRRKGREKDGKGEGIGERRKAPFSLPFPFLTFSPSPPLPPLPPLHFFGPATQAICSPWMLKMKYVDKNNNMR